jgi:SAM-dependent methyltransferase
MEAEYDQMAEEYDATREVATEDEVKAISDAFEGGTRILDVGVGTGRFAKPISGLGLEVTGIDVSRRMMFKARAKGLDRLVQGDAYELPFKDKSFDATMVIHVIHVVADWAKVMREIGRVTRGNVVTILRVRQNQNIIPGDGRKGQGVETNERGYPVRRGHRAWENEDELRERAPPFRLRRIRDETIEISVEDAFRRLEAKRPMAMQMVPPEMRRVMMERIIAMRGGQAVQRRIVEDLAIWKAAELEKLA